MTAPSLGARLIRAARNQAIITIVISAALLVAQAGVARRFGSGGLGEYTVTSLGVYIAGALAAIAIPITVGREAAHLEERHEHAAAMTLIGVGLLMISCLAIIGGVGLALVWDRTGGFVVEGPVVEGPAIAAAVVGGSIGGYAARIFQARLKVAAAGLVAIAHPLAVVMALGWDTISPGVRPSGMAVAGYLLTGAIGGVGLTLSGAGPRFDPGVALAQLRMTLPYAPLSYANHLAGLVDRLVVSVVLGAAALGVYQAASLLAQGPLRLLQSGISFSVSAYGRAATRGEEHGARLQRLSLRLWATYSAFVAGALIAGADGIITIYGGFGPSVGPLRILAVGLIPTAVSLTLLTAGAGRGRLTALLIARLAIPVQLAIGVILTSAIGVIGMPVALALVVVPVALAQMYWSRDPSLVPTRGLGLRLVVVAVIVPALSFIAIGAPVFWPIRALVVAALSGGLAAVLLLGPEEWTVIRQLVAFRSPKASPQPS